MLQILEDALAAGFRLRVEFVNRDAIIATQADALNTANAELQRALAELAALREECSRAYRETTTAGPLDHRIRLIKRELATAQARITELEEAQRWFSVEELDLGGALSSGQLLMDLGGGVVAQGMYSATVKDWFYASGERVRRPVLQWRPLPEPPGGGEA